MPSFETPQPIALSTELAQGMVHVIASQRTDTVVAVNPSDRERAEDVKEAQETVVDFVNGTLRVRGPKVRGIAGHLLGWGHKGSIDVVVEIPETSSLTADAGFADFRCDGRLGNVEVTTGAGSVRLDQTEALRVKSGAGQVIVEEISGSAEIATAGDITIGTVAGNADIKNLNGKTRIAGVGGRLKVRSANGDVTIEKANGDVSAKTANGSIRLGQVARGVANVETATGGLEIGVKEGTAAWIDASTKFGRVQNLLSPSDHPEPSEDTVEVRARTAFGDVLIARAQAH